MLSPFTSTAGSDLNKRPPNCEFSSFEYKSNKKSCCALYDNAFIRALIGCTLYVLFLDLIIIFSAILNISFNFFF